METVFGEGPPESPKERPLGLLGPPLLRGLRNSSGEWNSHVDVGDNIVRNAIWGGRQYRGSTYLEINNVRDDDWCWKIMLEDYGEILEE